MSRSRATTAALGVGLVRLGAGVALGGAPRAFLRWEGEIPAGSSMVLLMRTVGIRDVALGLGTLHAARSESASELARWLGAGLLSDALDVAAGLISARTTGVRGVVSALVAAPVVAADLYALKLLIGQGAGASGGAPGADDVTDAEYSVA
jgi:hypothetical protein